MVKLAIVLSFCLCIAKGFAGETLKYDLSGSSNWIPYYIDGDKSSGILGELIPIILSKSGISGEQITLPPKRTNLALEAGLLDFDIVSPSWFENEYVSEQFVLSNAILPIKEYVVHLPKLSLSKTKLEHFNDQRIGTVRGYIYHNDQHFKRVDFSSEKELVKALATKRVEYAIIGDLPARYWSSKLNVPIEMQVEHSSGTLHIRLHKKYHYLLPIINKSILQLKKEGEIDKIIGHYIGNLAKQN